MSSRTLRVVEGNQHIKILCPSGFVSSCHAFSEVVSSERLVVVAECYRLAFVLTTTSSLIRQTKSELDRHGVRHPQKSLREPREDLRVP